MARYEHPLFDLEAQLACDGVEIRIRRKVPGMEKPNYAFCLKPREIENPQFAGTLQKQLYGLLHGYVIEMFIRNPQGQN
jgi:hypothetical protein